MKLKEWIIKRNLKFSNIAKILNISKGHFSLICNNKVMPRKKLINAIISYTNNEVTLKDFYNINQN